MNTILPVVDPEGHVGRSPKRQYRSSFKRKYFFLISNLLNAKTRFKCFLVKLTVNVALLALILHTEAIASQTVVVIDTFAAEKAQIFYGPAPIYNE